MTYCGLNKFIQCFVENNVNSGGLSDADLIQQLERRRFGINNDGDIIYDPIYGEPINVDSQPNYISDIISCRAEVVETNVDNESHIGGRPDNDDEYCKFKVSLTADIKEGDIIIFPIGSNKSYIVDKDRLEDAGLKRIISCYHNVRSTK